MRLDKAFVAILYSRFRGEIGRQFLSDKGSSFLNSKRRIPRRCESERKPSRKEKLSVSTKSRLRRHPRGDPKTGNKTRHESRLFPAIYPIPFVKEQRDIQEQSALARKVPDLRMTKWNRAVLRASFDSRGRSVPQCRDFYRKRCILSQCPREVLTVVLLSTRNLWIALRDWLEFSSW